MVAINLLEYLNLSNLFYGSPSAVSSSAGYPTSVVSTTLSKPAISSSTKAVLTSLSAKTSSPLPPSSSISAKLSSSKVVSASTGVPISTTNGAPSNSVLRSSSLRSISLSTRSLASSVGVNSASSLVSKSRSSSFSTVASSAASASVASSGRSYSSLSSPPPSASVIYVSGCPPITVSPAITTTVTGFSYTDPVWAATVTSTTTIPRTITVPVTTRSNTTITVPKAVSTYFYTSTAVTISVIPAGTTVTAPISAGFTPVLCEPVYNQPLPVTVRSFEIRTQSFPYTTTSYVVVYLDSTTSTYAQSTIYESTIVATADYTSTAFVPTTVTSTSTRADHTSTIYDACATNNVVSRSPYGGYIDFVIPNAAVDGISSYLFVGAIDPLDCCSQCQSNSTCTGSAYLDSAVSLKPCVLFNKSPTNDQTCDSSFIGGIFRGNASQAMDYISNSGCGQLGFDYSL